MDFDPRDPKAWRGLCEFLESRHAAGQPTVRTPEVPMPQLLLASHAHPCGLTGPEVYRIQCARKDFALLTWLTSSFHRGWQLQPDWRRRLADQVL